MSMLMKWTLVFAVLMMVMQTSRSWTIGSKGRVTGPAIHTTYFLTPNNAPFQVHATAYVGRLIYGNCAFQHQYDLGTETIQTGDFIDIDAFALKSIVGNNYSCMTIFYNYKQVVRETFALYFDGVNYNHTFPQAADVTIL